jgi:NitT/TauT family transport system substrate-binding protein
MKRTFLSIVMGLTALLSSTASHALDAVTVGVVNSSSDVAFYIALNAGYFQQQGIEPKFETFDSAARMIAPLGAGQLDVGAGAVGAGLYNAAERGINIKIVADKAHCAPDQSFVSLLVRKSLVDSGEFKGYGDLKGRKVALAGAGTGDSSTLDQALKKGGAAGFADANVVYMGFSQQAAAFQNGAIDASLTAEPSVALILATGSAVRFAGVGEIYANQQTAVMLYAGEFSKQRPDVARRFMKAYILGLRDYNAALKGGKLTGPKGDAVIDLLTRHTSVKDPVVLRAMVPHAVDPNGQPNVASLKNDRDFFAANGLITQKIDVADILDDSFRQTALAELEKEKR